MTIKRFLVFLPLLLASCVSAPTIAPPVSAGRVETVLSEVSVFAGNSARGILAFQAPNCFRFTILSPLGLPYADAFSSDDNLVLVLPSQGIAYTGRIADLPEKGPFSHFRLLPWVAAISWDPGWAGATVTGNGETAVFDSMGFLADKVSAAGEKAFYSDYVDGGNGYFPSRIVLKTPNGNVDIRAQEPRVNQEIPAKTFAADLKNYRILPLRALQDAPAGS